MLADLDELILRCRDERARSYIAEAVACYRGAAYRSAIVATWIAVCYDIIDKLRDLALAGDKGAEKVIETLDAARHANDLIATLSHERKLIDIARDQFELISHLEHVDLERLREDRNRCAHPSLISEEVKFSASAELARVHIRAAVTHLLEHPPAQGKFALDRLTREVSSEYFPTSEKEAQASLSMGPLKRPRESLVRNFVVVLVKWALNIDSKDYRLRLRIQAAVAATKKLHYEKFVSVFREKVNLIFQEVEDDKLDKVISLLLDIQDIWPDIAPNVRNRLENYVSNLPQLDRIEELLCFPPLGAQARRRLALATIAELDEVIFFAIHGPIADKYIHHYLGSNNFSEANQRSKVLVSNAGDLSEPQQRRILAGIDANAQIRGSFEVAHLISALRGTNKIETTEFDAILSRFGLTHLTVNNA